ncbi:MAG: hypothetical protein QG642_484 [Patescibacteria group bacterium]|nr:hypothetical protein [Patescibacteria group bacterium]
MEYKKAADVLIKMSQKRGLQTEEKEALSEAIGVLAWMYLYKNRIKAIRVNRERRLKREK